MKKLLLLLLMPLAVLTASAQNNDYNMVIELKNGTKVTLGANDVESLTFNGEALSISGNTIADLYSQIAELRALIEKYHPEAAKKEFTVNGVSFKMVRVAGGTFQMGATPEQESDAGSNEYPVHSVTLSDYYIGETEVTQALWYAVMGQSPTSSGSQWESSYGLGDNYPAYYVSWQDCQTFISKLNELTGMSFRLPTEAEWEFAARGGNSSQGYKYAGSNTIGDVAWYYDNSYALGSSSPNYGTHAVGTKDPNELGLYDMSGNVCEWCQDWYSSSPQTNPTGPSSGSNRVIRGASWCSNARYCRVAFRVGSTLSFRYYDLGLRLAL